MTKDEKYIRRCIQLARNGLCNAAPNPMVGAVVVYQDRIIGEGYHARCGEGHAEVNALRSVRDESLLKEATLYVSLEPCSHYGKTPPCADLIISKGIPRVVVGCMDPFPLVAGRGIRKLKEAGVDVMVGVLEEECRQLVQRFVTLNIRKRPYVTLKWAQSADGFMDRIRQGGSPTVLSTPLTSMYVHKLRAEYKAILVGRRTALLDNPSLTTRNWYGPDPLRLVIDRKLTLPRSLRLFDGTVPTLVFTELESSGCPVRENVDYQTLDFGQDILPQIMQVLYERKIQSLLVEGGSCLLQSFIASGLWDDIRVEHSRQILHDGIEAPVIPAGYAASFEIWDHVCISRYVNAH